MKKILSMFLILFLLIGLWSIQSNTQVNIANSTWGATGYIGWNTAHDVP